MTTSLPQRIAAACAGDNEVFCQLMEEHQAGLRAFIGRYIEEPEDVLDLVQETFITAHKNLSTFEADRELGAWLRGIARNLCLDFVRSQTRRFYRQQSAMQQFLHEHRLAELEEGDDADDALARIDRGRVRDCMERLKAGNERSYRLIQLKYFEDRSSQDIAPLVGMTATAVRMALGRIRKSLKTCLENPPGELPHEII